MLGAALAGKAVEGLVQEAGIPGLTLAAWELAWQQGRNTLDADTILVLDEAGMVASRQMAGVVERVSRAGAKLVLVGDCDQLQPIEAGAAFLAITERIGYVELQTIYRQRENWMRVASLDLACGRIDAALAAYGSRGRVHGSALKAEAINQLINDWDQTYNPAGSTLILAHLRRDVQLLNAMARARLVARGLIEQGSVFLTQEGERHFAAGDRIVFLKNEGSLGVRNGMLAKLVEAQAGRIVAVINEAAQIRRIEVDQRFYNNLDHGYATTIHKSQGATVDRVKVLPRRAAKETTLDYGKSRFYAEALRFASSRGMHLVRVARTLLRDQLGWTLRQKERLQELGRKLQAHAARLGLNHSQDLQVSQAPLLTGVSTFALSLAQAAEARLQADAGLGACWQDLSRRIRMIYADPQAALQAMDFAGLLDNRAASRERLQHLEQTPQVFGSLRGRQGLFASRSKRQERRIAVLNGPALRTDIERYLRMRETALKSAIAQDEQERARLAIDIPPLSVTAMTLLQRAAEAIERRKDNVLMQFKPSLVSKCFLSVLPLPPGNRRECEIRVPCFNKPAI